MARFVARRLLGMFAVLFAISVIVFLIFNVIPNSDPAARIAGQPSNVPLPQGAASDGAAEVRSRAASARARRVKQDVIVWFAPRSTGCRH